MAMHTGNIKIIHDSSLNSVEYLIMHISGQIETYFRPPPTFIKKKKISTKYNIKYYYSY